MAKKLTEKQFENYKNDFIIKKDIKILVNYEDYVNNSNKMKCICLLCNKEFNQSLVNLQKKNNHGCFKISSGERIVLTFLEHNGIKYDYQVYTSLGTISDFEIKLKDNKILHLEIDGDQHYNYPNEFHKTYEDFIKAQKRDSDKDKLYLKNGHMNLHIRYNHGGKNNDNILKILEDIKGNKYGVCILKEKNLAFNIQDLKRIDPKNKKIISYNLNGEYLNTYESILDAVKDLNIDKSSISECLRGKRNISRAGNYIFKLYEDNYPLNIEPYKFNLSKEIILIKDNIEIKEFPSLKLLCEEMKIAKSTTCRYLNGKGRNPLKNGLDLKYKQKHTHKERCLNSP